jgi:hypothetical protein
MICFFDFDGLDLGQKNDFFLLFSFPKSENKMI